MRPRDPFVTPDEGHIAWEVAWSSDDAPAWGIDGLLDAYCSLARSQPEEMAAFVAEYGVPEVRGYEVSEGVHGPLGLRAQTMQAGRIPIRELRWHARAVDAARRVSARLVMRRCGEASDWVAILNDLDPGAGLRGRDDLGDWKLERELFTACLSDLLETGRVGMLADWLGSKSLALEPVARSFVGVIGLLLAREVGAEGAYVCDSCGAHVARARPPRSGERVYCERIECKREQRRRNQAAWRAKQRGGTDG